MNKDEIKKNEEDNYNYRVIIQKLDGGFTHQKQWRIKGQHNMLEAVYILNKNKNIFIESLSKKEKYEQFKKSRTVKVIERV